MRLIYLRCVADCLPAPFTSAVLYLTWILKYTRCLVWTLSYYAHSTVQTRVSGNRHWQPPTALEYLSGSNPVSNGLLLPRRPQLASHASTIAGDCSTSPSGSLRTPLPGTSASRGPGLPPSSSEGRSRSRPWPSLRRKEADGHPRVSPAAPDSACR